MDPGTFSGRVGLLLDAERSRISIQLHMFGRTYAATATLPARRYYNCKGKDLIGSGRAERCPQRTIKADEVEPSSGITSLRYYVIPSNSSHSLRRWELNPTHTRKESCIASTPRNNG